MAEPAPLVSVLLPTRNRLEYLRHAVQTVLRQDDGDWELVISDNASEEDIAGHVAALDDPRVRYVRTSAFVPVTDNWNNALAHSRGRYVVMLGDDDGLMPGYVRALRALVERFGDPELVYGGAWLFSYPGVDPAEPDGFLQNYGYATFLRSRREPFVLDRRQARAMVRHALRFRARYGFNMQFSTVARTLVERLAPQGPFFQSAFPDYYATNVALLTARRIAVTPQPLVAIGVTPRSYGFFHLNAQERAGRAFLAGEDGDRPAAPPALADMPGTNINSGWLSAVEAIAARYPELVPALPSRRRFRLLQTAYVYERALAGAEDAVAAVPAVEAYLTRRERALAQAAFALCLHIGPRLPPLARRVARGAFYELVLGQFVHWDPPRVRGRYGSLLDVFEHPPPAPPPATGPWRQRLGGTA
jgi:hypothetical protein